MKKCNSLCVIFVYYYIHLKTLMGITPSIIENCNCYLNQKKRERYRKEEISRLKREEIEKDNRITMLEEKIKKLDGIRTENEEINTKLYKYSKENDILLIPLVNDYEMDNLYPIQDEVEKWNTFIVGNDKTYIMARNKDFLREEDILNNKGIKMDKRMFEFLDRIWDITLKGEQIQIFVYMYSRLYLLNSYSFKNKRGDIIGACCFLREAGLIDKKAFQSKADYDKTIISNLKLIEEEEDSRLNTNDNNIPE